MRGNDAPRIVIPAEAGIQNANAKYWIPIFTGMTKHLSVIPAEAGIQHSLR